MVIADETNREGHSAKVYFNALFGKDFSREDFCGINSALDYGYMILLSCVSREVVSNGCVTQLGIKHKNEFNQFNLASDLMEPFRQIIDFEVAIMEPQSFGSDEKRQMQRLLQREVLINSRKETLINAIKIYCKSIFDAIEQRDVCRIKFMQYEL